MSASARDRLLFCRSHHSRGIASATDRAVDPHELQVQPLAPDVAEHSAHDLAVGGA